MTPEEFKAVLPAQFRGSVNQEVMDMINQVLSGPDSTAAFKENLLSYTSVLQGGKFKMTSYVSAVRYVSFLLLGGTNKAAFSATFPDKIASWNQRGVSEKDQASYISAYHKSKLVVMLLSQTLVPIHVLNAPLRQQAINVQADLMMSAKSEKVRSDAAACLIRELAPPPETKMELDIQIGADKAIDALRETTQALIEQQKAALRCGATSVKSIAEGVIIVNGD